MAMAACRHCLACSHFQKIIGCRGKVRGYSRGF